MTAVAAPRIRPSRRACCSVWWRPSHTISTAPITNSAMTPQCEGPPVVNSLASNNDRRTVAEQALVGGDADGGALDLAAGGLALELPGQLADLGDGLRRDRLAEAGQPAGWVDRDAAADGGRAAPQQLLGLTLWAQSEVLVPVQFQRG